MRCQLAKLVIVLLLVFTSCKKDTGAGNDSAEILSFSIPGVNKPDVMIDGAARIITLRFPDEVMEAKDKVATFELSNGARAYIGYTPQKSGETKNNFESELEYVIKNNGISNTWKIRSENTSYGAPWGLGYFVTSSKSNDRDYEWYMDQTLTGEFSLINCGPTSVTMAIKWADANFSKSPADARAVYRPQGGAWYNYDIIYYLSDNNIPNATIILGNTAELHWQQIKKQLDYDRLVILLVDIMQVKYHHTDDPTLRINRFYGAFQGGHFIVVKGYRVVDGKRFFEIYDPYGANERYADGTLKGKNRYYEYTDLFKASVNWWNYAMVVAPKGPEIDPGTLREFIPKTIVPDSPNQ